MTSPGPTHAWCHLSTSSISSQLRIIFFNIWPHYSLSAVIGHFPAPLSFLAFWFCFSAPPGTWQAPRARTAAVRTQAPISAGTDRLHGAAARLTALQGREGKGYLSTRSYSQWVLAVAQPPGINFRYTSWHTYL